MILCFLSVKTFKFWHTQYFGRIVTLMSNDRRFQGATVFFLCLFTKISVWLQNLRVLLQQFGEGRDAKLGVSGF